MMEQMEEERENILDFLSELECECSTSLFFQYALEKLEVIFKNILKNPKEDKFKNIKQENKIFFSNVGRHQKAVEMMLYIGFNHFTIDKQNHQYKFTESTEYPRFHLCYDEIRTALAKC
jgi:hypothetical protein